MTSHRLFFALRPDEETVRSVTAIQKLIPAGKGRPVPASRLHVTLVFLGAQDAGLLESIVQAAAAVTPPQCTVELDHCGHFPRASVAWLGASRVPAALSDFQAALADGLGQAGIRFDARPWKMHMTLYRNLRKRPETIRFEPVAWSIHAFELMESISHANGLEYVTRGRWSV